MLLNNMKEPAFFLV